MSIILGWFSNCRRGIGFANGKLQSADAATYAGCGVWTVGLSASKALVKGYADEGRGRQPFLGSI